MSSPTSQSTANATYRESADTWAFYYEEAGQAFLQQIRLHCPRVKDQVTAIAHFISMAASLREYAVNFPDDIRPMWDLLRKDDRYLDCLMGATASFFQGYSKGSGELANQLVTSIHQIYPTADVHSDEDWCVADGSFRESLGSPAALRQLFVANPWLMVFILIKRSGVLSLSTSTSTTTEES